MGDTEGEVEEKRERLQSVTSEWKPNLQKMVAEVDANFSAYFARFNCVGNVELADGRKANPHTGALEGPDDYAAYKVRTHTYIHAYMEGPDDYAAYKVRMRRACCAYSAVRAARALPCRAVCLCICLCICLCVACIAYAHACRVGCAAYAECIMRMHVGQAAPMTVLRRHTVHL